MRKQSAAIISEAMFGADQALPGPLEIISEAFDKGEYTSSEIVKLTGFSYEVVNYRMCQLRESKVIEPSGAKKRHRAGSSPIYRKCVEVVASHVEAINKIIDGPWVHKSEETLC